MSKEIQKQQMSELNRRGFIRAAGGCSALSSTAIMSSLVNLKATNAAMAMQSGTLDDYKAWYASSVWRERLLQHACAAGR